MSSESGSSPRVENLDLLRACAIALVVLFHSVQMATGKSGFATFGQFGVDLFFALSGFLIGGLYWSERKRFGSVHRLRFIARRAARTIPPYLIGLVLAYAAVYVYRDEPFDMRYFAFLQNYELRIPYFSVSWSLCIEEHFYLTLPFVLGAVANRKAGYVPGVLLLLTLMPLVSRAALVGAVVSQAQPFGFYTTATHLRMEGLALGVFASYVAAYQPSLFSQVARLRWWAIAGAVGTLAILPRTAVGFMYVAGYTMLAVAFAILVSVAASDRAWRIARSRLTHTIAVTSYSIYLTHALPIQLFHQIDVRFRLGTFTTWTLMVLSSVAVGYVFYRLVELPAIRFRDRFIPRRAYGVSAAAEVSVVA